MYVKVNDDIEIKKFLSKDKILDLVDEESIYEMIFGFRPKEFDYITSPFREDNNPSCWFEYSPSGKLKFVDFASNYYVNGVQMINIDCFDAIKIYYRLPNFYETLLFIYNHLIKGKEISIEKVIKEKKKVKKKEKKRTEILIRTRAFNQNDATFWSKYGISSQNLTDDKVFAILEYKITGYNTVRSFGICYAYTDFKEGRKKIYNPYGSKSMKWRTNLSKDDIGGLNALSDFGDKLIITKSYKDYRVLKNLGYHVIWFQNEGMFPTSFVLLPILTRFKETIIFFDNDKAGKEASGKLIDYIKQIDTETKVKNICLPDHPKAKDPSDYYFFEGEKKLSDYLKTVI